jgi:hypothetical protein
MLAPGSFAPGEAVGLPAIVKLQRADQALVSFLVSFSYVRPGSPGHSRPCRRRSQTVTTGGERGPTDLERVLGCRCRATEEWLPSPTGFCPFLGASWERRRARKCAQTRRP